MSVGLSVLCLPVSLIAVAVGQLLFKMHCLRRRKLLLFLSFCAFILGPVFSFLALHHLSLSVVYMSTALTNVLVLVLSRIFLHENITGRHMVSMGFIVAGIVIFNI